MSENLTAKQELFCREYIVDLNATQAAIRAGYSKKTATEQSSRLLTNVKIGDFIAKLKTERNDQVGIDAQWVLQQMKDIHELDVIDILDDHGDFKRVTEWPKSWRMYISGLDIQELMTGDTSTLVRKIKWPDKVRNLEMIGKHVDVKAWEKEKETVTVSNNIMPVPVADSVESWEAAAQVNQSELLNHD